MRMAVIGGGIAGLAAAWEARGDAEVTVFEPGPLGGKIRTTDFDGRPVDEGPDAFLTRVPEAVELCRELDLSHELVAPAAGRTLLWTGGRLRRLPEGLVLGVPKQLRPIATSGLLSPLGMLRAAADLLLPPTPPGDDVSVGELIARRFGPEVAERLVEPLVGGIHAARIDQLSAAATVPQLLAAARKNRSLLRALRATPSPPPGAPMFLTPAAGVGRLVERLHQELDAAGVKFRATAAGSLEPTADHAVRVDGEHFDAAVVATEASSAARLLGAAAPTGLGKIETTTVTLVTMSFDAAEVPAPEGINGILVPPGDGRVMTALSFGSNKWPQWASPGRVVVRVSAGRHGDERAAALGDEALVSRLTGELAAALGTSEPTPGTWRVSRWPASFPLYQVGHRDLVAALDPPRQVALAGCSYDGAGLPACIGSGRRAARRLLDGQNRHVPEQA